MSDARLRELERRWKETGSADDEGAYLLERVRVGDLTRERLELAAYCGHEGARRAVGDVSECPGEPAHWLGGFLRWGAEAFTKAVLAVVPPLHRRLWSDNPYLPVSGDFFAAAQRWCECPCQPHADEMDSLLSDAHDNTLAEERHAEAVGQCRGTSLRGHALAAEAAAMVAIVMARRGRSAEAQFLAYRFQLSAVASEFVSSDLVWRLVSEAFGVSAGHCGGRVSDLAVPPEGGLA